MGALLRPGATFPISLDIDMDIPLESRPKFLCRALTADEDATFVDKADEIRTRLIDGAIDKAAYNSELYDLLHTVVVGWENQTPEGGEPIPYSRENWPKVVTPIEARQLCIKVPAAAILSVEEKKS